MTTSSYPVTPVLINATGKPVRVLVGDKVVKLEEIPEPHLIGTPDYSEEEAIEVKLGFDSDGETISLKLYGELVPRFTVNSVPPVSEKVIYLVTEETFSQFPYRPDFVVASLYTLLDKENGEGKKGKKKKESKKKESKKKAGKKAGKKKGNKGKYEFPFIDVLSHVTYHPHVVAWTEETTPPDIDHDGWVEVDRPTLLAADPEFTEIPYVKEEPLGYEPTAEEKRARLSADYDFFYGPDAEYPVENSLIAAIYREDGTTLASEPEDIDAWVKGVGTVKKPLAPAWDRDQTGETMLAAGYAQTMIMGLDSPELTEKMVETARGQKPWEPLPWGGEDDPAEDAAVDGDPVEAKAELA